MSVESLMVHSVVVQAAAQNTDRYGATIKDWDNAATFTTKAWISRKGTNENTDQGREAFVSDWIGFFPAGLLIHGADRVTWDGLTFEVVGEPNKAWSPRGEHHIEARLKVVEG